MINLSNSLSSFDPKERARFRARKSHWIKKGFSPEKAENLALNGVRHNGSTPFDKSSLSLSSNGISEKKAQVSESTAVSKSKASIASVSASAKQAKAAPASNTQLDKSSASVSSSYEPTRREIKDVVRQMKSFGLMHEIHSDASLSGNFPSMGNESFASFLSVAFSLIVVSGASSLLISANLEVFGNSWQGWVKAVLLELSIIGLYLYPAADRIQWVFSKGVFLFLLCISFFVLHSGNEKTKEAKITSYEMADHSINEASLVKKELLSSLAALPSSYVTKRQPVLDQIKEIDIRIEQKRAELKASASAQIARKTAISELLLRLSLVLVNLIYSHHLFRAMGGIFSDLCLTTNERGSIA